jgi:hypothetical protein
MNIPNYEEFANLVDTLQNVEPWFGPNDEQPELDKSIPVQRITAQTKSLGISLACPTKLPSIPTGKSTTEWMIIAENAEYPLAQLRVAPIAAPPEKAITVGIILDDGFPICCLSAQDALQKKRLMAQQEAASVGGKVAFDESKMKVISQSEAIGQWVMTSAGSFPPLLCREKLRVWNGMVVAISVVGPKDKISMEDFELVFEVACKTCNLDHTALRLATGGVYTSLERILIASPTMNCMVNLPLPRRVLLSDGGAAKKPVEHHALPPLPGIVLTRMINPFTDSCVSLIALETRELTNEEDMPVLLNKKRTPHYIRQVQAHFNANTSIPTIQYEDGTMYFTAPALGEAAKFGGTARICCAVRPIPPRLGADPRLFLVLVASRVYQMRKGEEQNIDEIVQNVLVPELMSLISPRDVFISSVPATLIGDSTAKGVVGFFSKQLSIDVNDHRPPACRYFIVQHQEKSKSGKNASANSYYNAAENPELATFQAIQYGDATEFHMSCFCAGNNNATAIVTRCLWGELAVVADGSGHLPAIRTNVMHKMVNKSTDNMLSEARYRAMMVDPQGTAKTAKCGSYDVLMITPSDVELSSIKCGFHFARTVGGETSSCTCSMVVVMDTGIQ